MTYRFIAIAILLLSNLHIVSAAAQSGGSNKPTVVELTPSTTQTLTISPTQTTTTEIPFDRYATFSSQIELSGRNNALADFAVTYPSMCSQVFGEYRALFEATSSVTALTDSGVLAGIRIYDDENNALVYQEGIDGFTDYLQDFSRQCSNDVVTLSYSNFRIRNANANTFTIEFYYDNAASIDVGSNGSISSFGADGEPAAGSYDLTIQVAIL